MSKIPAGATHEGKGECRFYVKDLIPGLSFSFCNEKSDGTFTNWRKSDSGTPLYPITPISRDWNGPEDGLPPVGLDCIFTSQEDFVYSVRILAHGIDEGEKVAIVQGPNDIFMGPAAHFRPIRTAEQLAAEERAKVIDEMAAVYKSNYEGHVKDGCEALYDAGYRKVKP